MKKLQNLVGEKFGKLLVLNFVNKTKKRHRIWSCQCECGKIIETTTSRIKNIEHCSKSCPLIERYNSVDLIGEKFGKLTVISGPLKKGNIRQWKCKCDCGKISLQRTSILVRNKVKSCGCLKTIKYTGNIPKYFIGHIKSVAAARELEFNITVEYLDELYIKQKGACKFTNSELFFNKSGYNKDKKLIGNASLDRIDSDKGYIEGNVQWVRKDINYMKGWKSDAEFIKICKIIADNFKNSEGEK